MQERHVDLETPQGIMDTFVVHPQGTGPFPVVLFYMDAPGKREELHDMARRIATAGYYVVLPNLYYRSTDEFVLDFETGANRDEMFDLMMNLSNRMIVSDTRAMIDFVDGEADADASGIGCVGYCMSGPFALSVAAAYPDRVRAAASIYGVRLAVDAPDSPHLGFPQTTGELYIAAAETDEYAPPEMIAAVEEAIGSSGVNGRVEWYPGTHHGFAFPKRQGVYVKAAGERHWERMFALFERRLKAA